jgi:hypothetical protein
MRCLMSFTRVSYHRGTASIYDSAIDVAGGLAVLLVLSSGARGLAEVKFYDRAGSDLAVAAIGFP